MNPNVAHTGDIYNVEVVSFHSGHADDDNRIILFLSYKREVKDGVMVLLDNELGRNNEDTASLHQVEGEYMVNPSNAITQEFNKIALGEDVRIIDPIHVSVSTLEMHWEEH
jgi:hypothetical protein